MAVGALAPLVRYVVMNDGQVAPGAKAYFYLSGTNTAQPVYQNSALTVAHAQPVEADADGVLPPIYFSAVAYRMLITDANGATIFPATDDLYDFAELQLAASGGSGLIGYIQSGSGAVAQTVQGRLRQKVSVVDFGAVGDGVTNDLAAFQLAVTRAGSGGTVFIPALTNGKFYNLGTGLVITSKPNIEIVGESANAVIAATSTGAYALSFYGCNGFKVRGLTIQGVAGGGGAIVVGKSDGTAPSFFGTIQDLTIPVNFDADAILGNHCMSLKIDGIIATADATRPSTDSALNGGVYGPNVATITAGLVNIPLQASGQSNAITLNEITASGWRGNGIMAEGVDGLLIQGRDITGNCRNYSLLTNPGQIKLTDCSRVTIETVYTETLAAGASNNLYLDGCKDIRINNVIYGADTNVAGFIRLTDCQRGTITNCFGEGVVIDNTCFDIRCDAVSYGGNGAGFVDNGIRSQRSRMVNISASNNMAGGQSLANQMNLLGNPGFEQWTTAAAPMGWTVTNLTALRTGTGEADTNKFRGRYACKISTRTNATNGLIFTITDYANATTRAAMVNTKVTISAWVYVTAGTALGLSAFYDGSTSDDAATNYTVGTDGWKKVSESFVVRSGFSTMDVRVVLRSDATVAYVDEAAVYYGEAQTYAIADRLSETGAYGASTLTFSATPTIDHAVAPFQSMTLTGDVTGVTMSNGIVGKTLTIKITQDGTGGYTVSGWPASMKWNANTAPVFSAAANDVSSITVQYDGTNWWQIGGLTAYQ